MSHIEGPFELFDERKCKIQLMIALPRELVKGNDAAAILQRVADIVELHRSAADAEYSISGNGREREDYPPDYDQTLARYEVWKVEMLNAAVADRIAGANQDARSVAVDIRRNPDFLDGFAAGVAEMRSWRQDNCDRLVDIVFSSVRERPPGDHSATWKEGYSDGQEMIDRLGGRSLHHRGVQCCTFCRRHPVCAVVHSAEGRNWRG